MSGYANGERYEVVENNCCGGSVVYTTNSRAEAEAIKLQYKSAYPENNYSVTGGTIYTM